MYMFECVALVFALQYCLFCSIGKSFKCVEDFGGSWFQVFKTKNFKYAFLHFIHSTNFFFFFFKQGSHLDMEDHKFSLFNESISEHF